MFTTFLVMGLVIVLKRIAIPTFDWLEKREKERDMFRSDRFLNTFPLCLLSS